MRFLIDPWFSIQGVHLIGGPSGVGKSTWLIEVLNLWRQGKPVFGHPSHPVPFVYIGGDRGRADMCASFYGLNLNPNDWPLVAHDDVLQMENCEQIIKRAKGYYPNAKAFFIEGIASLMPGGGDSANSNGKTQKFLKTLGHFNKCTDSTIIGTVHTTKAKKDEGYEIAREKIMGAAAWGGYSNTIIDVAFQDPSNPKSSPRVITVLPRRSAVEQFRMAMNDQGFLELITDEQTREKTPAKVFRAFLSSLPTATTKFEAEDLIAFFASYKPPQSQPTAYRELKEQVKAGNVRKVGGAKYEKIAPDAIGEIFTHATT